MSKEYKIEICVADLLRIADEWKRFISSPEGTGVPEWPNKIREAAEAKWKEYMTLTDHVPDPAVEERVRSIAMVNLA